MAEAQLAFDRLLAETQAIERVLDAAGADEDESEEDDDAPSTPKDKRRRRSGPPPTGRRSLEASSLPEVRVELPDPELEGRAERIGVETSSRVVYERDGYHHLVVARVVYKESVANDPSKTDGRTSAAPTVEPGYRIVTAPMPKEIVPWGFLPRR